MSGSATITRQGRAWRIIAGFLLAFSLLIRLPEATATPAETAQALYLRAFNELTAGKRLEALNHIDRALALQPKIAPYWLLKATIQEGLQENESALPSIDACLKYQPDLPLALGLKARILTGLFRHKEALPVIDKAIKADPKNIDYRITRAQILRNLARMDDVEKECDIVLKSQPNNIRALKYRAEAAQHLKHWDKAIADDTKLIELEKSRLTNRLQDYDARGQAYIESKQYQKAIANYKEAIAAEPDERQLHVGLIKAYKLAGDTKAAEAQSKILAKLDTEIVPIK